MDTWIIHGKLVSSLGIEEKHLLLRDGKIAAAEAELPDTGDAAVVDAGGRLVFPGFIDAHTHFEMENALAVTADDFASGTRAALAGGTTTILDFATQERGETLEKALHDWQERARGACSCDYGFHMAVTDWNARTDAELPAMFAAGVTSFKVYMAYKDLLLPDGAIFELLQRVDELGGIVGCHCENGGLIDSRVAALAAAGEFSPAAHPQAHSVPAEAEAVGRLAYLAEAAGTPAHIVHLSTARGLGEAMRARARGVRLYAETCPQYLLLDDALYYEPDFVGGRYVCSPPLRREKDRRALWGALSTGQITTVSTDHCSYTLAQKELGRKDFRKIPNGLPGVQERPALLYSYGVAAGRFPAERMAALLSENAARLFGLFPQKGTLRPGSDADVVIWDDDYRGVVTGGAQLSAAGYSPYEGMELLGRPWAVFLRGELAVRDGQPLKTGLGRYVARRESLC